MHCRMFGSIIGLYCTGDSTQWKLPLSSDKQVTPNIVKYTQGGAKSSPVVPDHYSLYHSYCHLNMFCVYVSYF